jgi:hypothetical protein
MMSLWMYDLESKTLHIGYIDDGNIHIVSFTKRYVWHASGYLPTIIKDDVLKVLAQLEWI